MESAIPCHLLLDRTRPRRVPDDYAPPYPSFVARSRPQVRQVVMAYLGLQFRGEQPPGALDTLGTSFLAADGPGHHDRARQTAPDGTTDIVSIAYWDDPPVFERWFAAHRESWLGDAVRDGYGRWAEVLRPTRGLRDPLLLARAAGGRRGARRRVERRGAGARLLGRDA